LVLADDPDRTVGKIGETHRTQLTIDCSWAYRFTQVDGSSHFFSLGSPFGLLSQSSSHISRFAVGRRRKEEGSAGEEKRGGVRVRGETERGGCVKCEGEGERKKIKERKEKEEGKDKGHVATCEWVGGDNEIFPSQPGCDTWQREITFLF
jgi:hypothetical protein